jgi:hypothetical protein
MILMDTDILTLWLLGQPRISRRVLGTSEEIATTVVSRIELLQGRFAYLLKASDGVQLQAAQSRLDQTGFFGPQHVETTAAQVNGQSGHDMAIQVQPNEERFKAGGIGHGPALPRR